MNTPQLPPQLLFTCPRCHRRGFTLTGLRAHRCRVPIGADPSAAVAPRSVPPEGRTRLTMDELASAQAQPHHP